MLNAGANLSCSGTRARRLVLKNLFNFMVSRTETLCSSCLLNHGSYTSAFSVELELPSFLLQSIIFRFRLSLMLYLDRFYKWFFRRLRFYGETNCFHQYKIRYIQDMEVALRHVNWVCIRNATILKYSLFSFKDSTRLGGGCTGVP